jgi:hypothetical protein
VNNIPINLSTNEICTAPGTVQHSELVQPITKTGMSVHATVSPQLSITDRPITLGSIIISFDPVPLSTTMAALRCKPELIFKFFFAIFLIFNHFSF